MSCVERSGSGRGDGRECKRVRGAHGERGRAVPRRSAAVAGRCVRAAALPLSAAAAIRATSYLLHNASGKHTLNITQSHKNFGLNMAIFTGAIQFELAAHNSNVICNPKLYD